MLRICLCDASITCREFLGSERFWCRCRRDGRKIDRDDFLNGEFLALAINDFGRKNVLGVDFESLGFGGRSIGRGRLYGYGINKNRILTSRFLGADCGDE